MDFGWTEIVSKSITTSTTLLLSSLLLLFCGGTGVLCSHFIDSHVCMTGYVDKSMEESSRNCAGMTCSRDINGGGKGGIRSLRHPSRYC